MGIAESIDPVQPAQSAQAGHGRNFSLSANFLCVCFVPVFTILYRSSNKIPFRMMGHI